MPLTPVQQAFKDYFTERADPKIAWGHSWIEDRVELIWSWGYDNMLTVNENNRITLSFGVNAADHVEDMMKTLVDAFKYATNYKETTT